MIPLLIVFMILLVIGIPIGFSILGASLLYFVLDGSLPLTIVVQKLISGPNSYILLAVPLFILAGNLMNYGGISKRIYNLANVVVGHMAGGLGQVNILGSLIFSGMSGSANADAAGIGLLEIKAMREDGYDDDFTLGITGASSLIGPIVPPSVPAILFSAASSVSVGSLFIGGIIPGIIMSGCLGIMVYIIAKKRHYPTKPKASLGLIARTFVDAIPSLVTPVIIIGGIWTGWFTATEAAGVAAIYAGFLSIIVYKDLKVSELPKVIYKSAYFSIPFIFVVAASMVLGWIIIREQAGQQLGAFLLSITSNKWIILTILNILLLILGMFLDPAVTILLLVPILEPILKTVGIDMVHFGIVMILNLMIGLLTPPVGSILNTLSTVAEVSFEKVAKSVMIFMLPLLISLILITYFPDLVTFLPKLLINQ